MIKELNRSKGGVNEGRGRTERGRSKQGVRD